MTDFVVETAMENHVSYGIPEIQSYRSLTHDVVKIYGFTFKNTEAGKIIAQFRIEEGLKENR